VCGLTWARWAGGWLCGGSLALSFWYYSCGWSLELPADSRPEPTKRLSRFSSGAMRRARSSVTSTNGAWRISDDERAGTPLRRVPGLSECDRSGSWAFCPFNTRRNAETGRDDEQVIVPGPVADGRRRGSGAQRRSRRTCRPVAAAWHGSMSSLPSPWSALTPAQRS